MIARILSFLFPPKLPSRIEGVDFEPAVFDEQGWAGNVQPKLYRDGIERHYAEEDARNLLELFREAYPSINTWMTGGMETGRWSSKPVNHAAPLPPHETLAQFSARWCRGSKFLVRHRT